MNSEWLTIPEVAEILGISSRTVRRWIKTGRLPADLRRGLHGPQYFIPRTAVLAHRRAEEERALRGLGLDASEFARQVAEQIIPEVEAAGDALRRELTERVTNLEQRLETMEAEIAALRQAVEDEG